MHSPENLSPGSSDRFDFFVSYAHEDEAWAEWIGWVLEEEGWFVRLQAWDFDPGSNFVLEMQKATAQAERTIAVLSPHSLSSQFTQAEWAAAFRQDPTGEKRILIPIRVAECSLVGLLADIVYVDIVGLEEDEAKRRLLATAEQQRRKPRKEPPYPVSTQKPIFPSGKTHVSRVPRANHNFTGREDLLTQLQEILSETGQASVTQAIAGMGGVGKTQLAIEYVHRNVDRYKIVAWIHAEETETLVADFADLAHTLEVPGVEGMPPEDLVRAVHAVLAERNDWLLVFDNAEGPSAIRPYLPPVGRGHILITSRDQNWRSISAPLDVSPFRREESIKFLIKRSGDTDCEGADAVGDALGDLPLALEQAGAYVETTHGTLKRYAELFAERHGDLWRDQDPPDTYHGTVATTWSLAIDTLAKEFPASVELMKLVSFLAADDIPLFLLTEGEETLPEPLRSVVSDEVALRKTVGALRGRSLVTKTADHLFVHRLVQLVIHDGMRETERDEWIEACLNLLRAVHDFREDDPETWKRCERLLPHVAAVVSHAEERGLGKEATSYLLNDAGMCLRTLSNLPLAKEYHERALKIDEGVYGPDHPKVARDANNLGGVLQDLGELAEARTAYERALKIDEVVYGPDHPRTRIIRSNLESLDS